MNWTKSMNIEMVKILIQAGLGAITVLPAVIVLSILALRGDNWAAYTLAVMAAGVLTFYGFKVIITARSKKNG